MDRWTGGPVDWWTGGLVDWWTAVAAPLAAARRPPPAALKSRPESIASNARAALYSTVTLPVIDPHGCHFGPPRYARESVTALYPNATPRT